ncbi:cobyrinate a,c-diamide synthase [Pseudooceanicola sediminis]|uniref:Hydrogenobyrinate a,c-diamide synthase n=1 Tax=Pseudooceanicola sediminis TaxID=2211117 RepID=A0A399J3A0_9RHOB|nr:cobyrinate a,c-diamide synthase [Pseudooceanicola sediminis]KAA2317388.1 cobyrinate a,c-diamide synthase [Puniceibacterium sp. HSS470]RII39741.1 cobyrinate a,c-diamide synthase [Pseudooceanicola sediminis]|tara:strand:+ start:9111 stop:10412 length:1302 start_codon:yes stop_codon:yes gene_type:complete
MKGLILAAPSSGAGKTTVTLALLRLLNRAGIHLRGAKSGPDYIDPKFHEAACRQPCINLDAWAMPPARIASLAASPSVDLLVIEGAMGLFDGAPPAGRGAVADLARQLALPVILIVDAGRMAQSVAPLVAGFAGFDPDVRIAGVILNRVGSARHARMLRAALAPLGRPVLGTLPRRADLALPSRHLGLVQAGETPDLDAFLDRAADALAAGAPGDRPFDLDTTLALASPLAGSVATSARTGFPPPPAQHIAVAQDAAFAFAYPHMLDTWRAAGAQLSFFSPLADDAVPRCDLVFLPGGYPELHAGRLAANAAFLTSLRRHAASAPVYGECGGYMVLGDALTDENGTCHAMAGLLRLQTSFQRRKLHLGYRSLVADAGPMSGAWAGHEFHYATTIRAEGDALFQACDAEGTPLPAMGLRQGQVCGSFAHLIEPA